MPTEDLFRKVSTLLRIGLHIERPEDLSDEEFGKRWEELKWAAKAGFLPFKLE